MSWKEVIGCMPEFEKHTCGECSRKRPLYLNGSKRRKVWKCDYKPHGWGYDITLKHVACPKFKL